MDNIFTYYFISTFVEARGASGHVMHTLVFLFKQKIIARDHRSRHPQTLTICCISIDGDIIIQMNLSNNVVNFTKGIRDRNGRKSIQKY